MDWARTVAVVVPSPATSLVLLATSRTIWAPMFSRLSLSSISLATVTPSLVMVGEPNFFSMTTLRPLVPAYLPNRMRSPSFTAKGKTLPSSLVLPRPTETTSPSCGLSLAESGMMMPPRVVVASSTRRTRMRSCNGVNLAIIVLTPFINCGLSGFKCRETKGTTVVSTHVYRVLIIQVWVRECQELAGAEVPGMGKRLGLGPRVQASLGYSLRERIGKPLRQLVTGEVHAAEKVCKSWIGVQIIEIGICLHGYEESIVAIKGFV